MKKDIAAVEEISEATMEPFQAQMQAMVRQQVMAELAVSKNQIDEMTQAKKAVMEEISQLTQQLGDIKARLNQKAYQLQNANAFLAKFSPEAIEELVATRMENMLAVMEGRSITPKKTRAAAAKTNVDGYDVRYAIDGQPRQFKTKTHLTYWLGQKLGQKVTVEVLNTTFQDQTSIVPFSPEHKDQGTITASFDGIQVSITLVKA